MNNGLNPCQQMFVKEYVATGNATKAVCVAGYGNGDNYSRLAGHRMLTNDNILRAVKEASEANGLSIDMIMTRLSRNILNGRDSDSLQGIKIWSDLVGANAPKEIRLRDELSEIPKTPEQIDGILERMRKSARHT